VIEHILRHLRLWYPRPPGQAPPQDGDWPVKGQIPLTYEPLPAIACFQPLTGGSIGLKSGGNRGTCAHCRRAGPFQVLGGPTMGV